MDHSIAFARHFARLLWLLNNEPGNIEEQKAALRALVTISRDGPVTVARLGDVVLANGQRIEAEGSGVRETAQRLEAHGIRIMAVQAAADPADLLTAARLLVAPPGFTPCAEALKEAGARTVHLFGDERVDAGSLFGDLELVADIDVGIDVRTPPDAREPVPQPMDPRTSREAYRVGGTLFDHFSATAGGHHEALLQELARLPDPALGDVLAALAQEAEQAQRRGDGATLLAIVLGMLERESGANETAGREIGLVVRRVLSSYGLRTLAGLLPRRAAAREDIVRVLMRAGDQGADAVIELLTEAQTATDRRAYFDVLRTMRAGIPTLVQMLRDDRWYVVRNAIDLLGELGAREAEGRLVQLLEHPDERVRQSAAVALVRLNTPVGRAAISAAAQSDVPQRRQQALVALGERRDADTASMLLRALDREGDEEVQRTIFTALGRVASADAVQRLVEAAQPPNGFFRRKSPAMRAAATLALGEARTAAAVDALRKLADDRDKDVRAAALRALANVRRGNEPRVTAAFEAIRQADGAD